jgi:hypothetical protein
MMMLYNDMSENDMLLNVTRDATFVSKKEGPGRGEQGRSGANTGKRLKA